MIEFFNNAGGCNTEAQVLDACDRLGRSLSDSGQSQGTAPEFKQDSKTTIYPNPTEGIVQVRVGKGLGGMVRLIDINGQVLEQQEIGEGLRFDLSTRPAGFYWLDIRFEDGSRSRERVVKK